MDLKQIEKLMASMSQAQMKRIVIKKEGFELELERECASSTPHAAPMYYAPPAPLAGSNFAVDTSSKPQSIKESTSSNYVTSPMVGTFYSSPSPDDPAYVNVGDNVNENTVMCIIEAMKVMNEVKAGIKGKIAEILLKSGDPVEFGTKIFRIDIS